jgi:hypothetical protein
MHHKDFYRSVACYVLINYPHVLQVLHGALVGGPDANDNWSDDRGNFQVILISFSYLMLCFNVTQ